LPEEDFRSALELRRSPDLSDIRPKPDFRSALPDVLPSAWLSIAVADEFPNSPAHRCYFSYCSVRLQLQRT